MLTNAFDICLRKPPQQKYTYFELSVFFKIYLNQIDSNLLLILFKYITNRCKMNIVVLDIIDLAQIYHYKSISCNKTDQDMT